MVSDMKNERSFQYIQRLQMAGADLVWLVNDTGTTWYEVCQGITLQIIIMSISRRKAWITYPFGDG